MISLVDFQDLTFFHDNPDFLKKINDNRYNDTNYSIVKSRDGFYVVFIIHDDVGVFIVKSYASKTCAIDEIENGKLKKEIIEQKILYDKLSEVI